MPATPPDLRPSLSPTTKPRTLTVGSCFAGIGGIDLGLEAATPAGKPSRFETLWHSEIKPEANRVMAAQFPRSDPLGDITALTGGFFQPVPVRVVAGGPPCQDVSISNSFGRLGLAGPKSGLFRAYAELVGLVQPDWVIMEQVTGLLTSGPHPGDDWTVVQRTYQELGYVIDVVVTNSLLYVPQTRERLVVVGHRRPGAAARALLPLREDGARHPDESRPTRRRPALADGASAGIYRKSKRPASNQHGESWVPCDYVPTLTLSDVGESRATVVVLDPGGRPRILTPVEWERCHGFPDGWTVAAGSDVLRWQTLGNTVTPAIFQRVGEGILAVEDAA